MEAVGVILGAVALLDPAYEGLRSLWKAYKIASNYGEDFVLSVASLRSQEWVNAPLILMGSDVYFLVC